MISRNKIFCSPVYAWLTLALLLATGGCTEKSAEVAAPAEPATPESSDADYPDNELDTATPVH